MKKKILLIIGIIAVLFVCLDCFEGSVSRQFVNHKESGNFINTEDLSRDKVTMLHWFSKEVQVYSEENEELSFVLFEPYKGLILYKNKELIMQNESPNYPMFQGGNYMVFSINSIDYIENRVDFYSEVVLDNSNREEYTSNYFVGNYRSINQLILAKKSMDILSMVMLLVGCMLLLLTHKKDMYGILLLAAAFLLLFDFRRGMTAAPLLIYFYSDKLVKKRIKSYLIIALFLLAFLIPFGLNQVYLLTLMVLSLVNYFKNNNIKSMTSLIVITSTSIYSLASLDFEFSLFRLFYENVFIIAIALFLIVISIFKLNNYYSKEKMVKVDLLRSLSHDIRLPLSTIKLNTELLAKDDFHTELNKDMILHIIKGAIDDLMNMTTSLTAYISSDNYVDNNTDTSIQDCIEHTANYFYNNEKHIDIKTMICEKELYLPIEKVWLNRLIFNLIDNAYKYTDEYGEIIISLKKEKKEIILSVQDNGIGMTSEQITKVSEPFYRVDSSRSISGLGLGLSIVKQIVDSIEGDVTITSKIGEGTKVTIKV